MRAADESPRPHDGMTEPVPRRRRREQELALPFGGQDAEQVHDREREAVRAGCSDGGEQEHLADGAFVETGEDGRHAGHVDDGRRVAVRPRSRREGGCARADEEGVNSAESFAQTAGVRVGRRGYLVQGDVGGQRLLRARGGADDCAHGDGLLR